MSENYRIIKDDELVFETPYKEEAWQVFNEQSGGTVTLYRRGTKLKERTFI